MMQETSRRIEFLTNRMDSALTRMEPLLEKVNITTASIADNLSKKPVKQEYQKQQPHVASQVEKYWKEGYKLITEGKYKEAIDQFEKVVNQDPEQKKETYYNIAVAYAKLSHGDFTESEQELYRDNMLYYLRKAARLGDKESQNLLKKYGESW
jgi:tetratricopeptide (TPR) repeat protein